MSKRKKLVVSEPRDRARARKGRQGQAGGGGEGEGRRRGRGGEAENKQNLTQGVRKKSLRKNRDPYCYLVCEGPYQYGTDAEN